MSRPALQLALPKIGIAWMFALLTVNFNRVTIYDLGIAAVVVTLLLGIYPLFAPIQPLFGRWIDQHPLMGYRRGPYLLLGMVGSGALFTALPWTAEGLRRGDPLAALVGIILMVLFGLGIALIANTYLDLVAETTDERSRSGVFAVAWTAQTAAIVLWSFVFQRLMPIFTRDLMQSLYNLTPLVCLVTTLLGIIGLEQRIDPQHIRPMDRAQEPLGNPLEALRVLCENIPARNFFAFVFLAITGIFLQDAVMEVYASRVLGMSLPESTQPQQIWNGAVLIAMLITSPLIAILTARAAATGKNIASLKRQIASAGAVVATFALWVLAGTAARSDGTLFYAVLALMGLGMGVFTAVTVTMMSDMTVEGATGRYLGLWSMAQAFATSFAFVASGALHTLLIESGWFAPGPGFALIFGLEGLSMLLSLVMLQLVSISAFRGAALRDLARLAPL